MNKKYLATLICTTMISFAGFSQTRSMKDLIGKWKEKKVLKGNDTTEFIFVNDTTFVVKDTKGFYAYPNRYRFDFSHDPIILTSLHKNQKGDYAIASLKFIDDRTLIYRFLRAGSYDISNDPKNVGGTFIKVDSKDYSDFANPTIATLRGSWRFDKYKMVNFINDTLASLKDGEDNFELYKYVADFTKVPYRADFKSLESKKARHAVFLFPTDSTMDFETFKGNDRRDNFTTFGHYHYLKIDSVRRLRMILKMAHQN